MWREACQRRQARTPPAGALRLVTPEQGTPARLDRDDAAPGSCSAAGAVSGQSSRACSSSRRSSPKRRRLLEVKNAELATLQAPGRRPAARPAAPTPAAEPPRRRRRPDAGTAAPAAERAAAEAAAVLPRRPSPRAQGQAEAKKPQPAAQARGRALAAEPLASYWWVAARTARRGAGVRSVPAQPREAGAKEIDLQEALARTTGRSAGAGARVGRGSDSSIVVEERRCRSSRPLRAKAAPALRAPEPTPQADHRRRHDVGRGAGQRRVRRSARRGRLPHGLRSVRPGRRPRAARHQARAAAPRPAS